MDGNKRDALLSGLTFLELNGITFVARSGEIENFAVKIATERLDVPVIARWLAEHSPKEL